MIKSFIFKRAIVDWIFCHQNSHSLSLCIDDMEDFFDIPQDIDQIEVCLYTRPGKNRYHIKPCNYPIDIFVDDEAVWVDRFVSLELKRLCVQYTKQYLYVEVRYDI